jgi:signal transduction histidine kinase
MRKEFHVPIIGSLLKQLRHMSLVNEFMLLSAVILLFGALVIGWWINREIEQQVLDNSLKTTAVFVDSTIAPHLWELSDLSNITDAQKKHLDQLLKSNIQSGEFVAFHIAKPDGTLVYSSLDIPLGTDMRTPGMEAALSGQMYSEETHQVDFAPPSAQQFPTMIETYFPVYDEAGTKIIAVASFYQSLDLLRQSILEAQLQGWVVVGIATFLMYILLFGLMRRGNDTIERQKLDLAESRRQIQHAAVSAAEVNEAAMRRLGADLHDGPAQDLGIALMRMEPLRQAVDQLQSGKGAVDPEVMAFDLNLIHTALQSSLQEIRNMASGLRLPDLKSLDLAGTIHKAANDYTRKTGREVSVTGPDHLAGNDALKSATYRIVQETLNNGHLHGNPTVQEVVFEVKGDVLALSISDNGSGFNPQHVFERGGRRQLGLAGLQERAEILGGHLSVTSEPGEGSTVEVILPLQGMNMDEGNETEEEEQA